MADSDRETALTLPLRGAALSAENATEARLETDVIALFDVLRAPLLRYLLSLGLGVDDGEEVVQEAFLALFQHLSRGGSRVNLRGWLFRVAHNLGLKRARRSKNWAPALEPDSIADSRPNPEQQAADSQRRKKIMAVFRALPEPDRQCLALRTEGLRYREIAEVLGLS